MIDLNFIQYLRERGFKERDIKILEDVMNGSTKVAAGKRFGITGNRVGQIYNKYSRMARLRMKHPERF